jgi:hypothetical protein
MTAAQPPAGFTVRDAITAAVVVIVLAFGVWLKVAVDITGTVVSGEVVGKHEAIEMPLSDTWRQVFEISYRYRPLGASSPATGRHPVDVALYERLRVGSPVNVRYVQLPLVGRAFGFDSALADSSWWSRAPSASESERELVEAMALVMAAWLGFVAYRRNSRPLVVVAVTAGATVACSVMLLGFLVFPALFWIWRGNRGEGLGWALLCSTALTAAALYYRVPWPSPPPSGPQGHATAVVRAVRSVDQIWASWSPSGESTGGQNIRRPFQMVDLEFVPAGRTESVHALDRVDLDSVPGLRPTMTVPVTYPLADPRAGRMSVGTRHYGGQIFAYLLALTYGLGAVVAFVICPAIFCITLLARRAVRSVPGLSLIFDPAARERLLSALPPDDPRRHAIERIARPRRESSQDPPSRQPSE